MESEKTYPPKVKAMYEAVLDLFASGRELNTLKVSEITAKAGIGKGTAYEYFSSKEDMIIGAIQYEAAKHVAIIFELLEEGQSFQEIIFRGMDMLEASYEKYGGFAMLEKILRDSTITGSVLADELEKYKKDCGLAQRLVEKLMRMAMEKGVIGEMGAFQVWSAILSQFVSYAFYLAHRDMFLGVEPETVKKIVYENILKLLN